MRQGNGEAEENRIVNEKTLQNIIYNIIFNRRLTIYYVFFTKIGLYLLLFFCYLYFYKHVSFIKSVLFLSIGLYIVSSYFYTNKYYEKFSMSLYKIKSDSLDALKRKRKINEMRKFF